MWSDVSELKEVEGRNRFSHHTCRLVGAFSLFIGEWICIMFKTFLNFKSGVRPYLKLKTKNFKKKSPGKEDFEVAARSHSLKFQIPVKGPKRLKVFVK